MPIGDYRVFNLKYATAEIKCCFISVSFQLCAHYEVPLNPSRSVLYACIGVKRSAAWRATLTDVNRAICETRNVL